MKRLTDWLGYGDSSDGWHTLAENHLLILVGLTGVGKTTTVNAMRDVGMSFRLLPNRRTLTDQLMIAEMQRRDGVPLVPVRDRAARFAYTRRYREQHVGGMAHVLSQLQTNLDEPLLFDGLRGVNEIETAVTLFPNARFLVLTAPNGVRLLRLVERRDAFDGEPSPPDPLSQRREGERPQMMTSQLLSEMQGLIEGEYIAEILQLVDGGLVDVAELRGKLKIVSAESQNYNPTATFNTLLKLAPERTLIGDTVRFSAEQIAKQARDFFPT